MNLQKATLLLDYCWVCGVRFKTSVPPGPANREDHHIFPRNAGGTDGPEVSLCEMHHSTAHKIAHRLHSKKPIPDLLAGEVPEGQKKLIWLATKIVEAERLSENDPNKLYRNGVQLTPAETEVMKKLQSIYPGKSRSDIFRHALILLYKSHFK